MEEGGKEVGRVHPMRLTILSLVMVALICSDPGVTVNIDLRRKWRKALKWILQI